MNLPVTVNKTARTQTVLVNGKEVKVKKSRVTVRSAGTGRTGEKWGTLAKTLKGWAWHCEDLGLVNLTRLEMEKELLNLAGNNVEYHLCSLTEWGL